MPDPISFPDASTLATPFYILLIVGEVLALRFASLKGSYETRDAITSLTMGLGSVISDALLGGLVFGLVLLAYQFRVTTIEVSWGAGILCFVLADLEYYWRHRLMHRSRWFWAAHVVHHSSQHYNLTTALRQSWTGPISGLIVLMVPIALLGFHPALIAFVASLNLVYQFWIHTETINRLPRWFEAVFNTPSHHRVHHGRNPRYLDANYAGTLIIWDRMFGTFVPEEDSDPVRYGIVKNIGTFNPLRVAFHEYVGIARDALAPGLTFAQRFLYIFAPPGYSHDGSRSTAASLKADFVARRPQEAGRPGLPQSAAPQRLSALD